MVGTRIGVKGELSSGHRATDAATRMSRLPRKRKGNVMLVDSQPPSPQWPAPSVPPDLLGPREHHACDRGHEVVPCMIR